MTSLPDLLAATESLNERSELKTHQTDIDNWRHVTRIADIDITDLTPPDIFTLLQNYYSPDEDEHYGRGPIMDALPYIKAYNERLRYKLSQPWTPTKPEPWPLWFRLTVFISTFSLTTFLVRLALLKWSGY
jgi:hypothetical protein